MPFRALTTAAGSAWVIKSGARQPDTIELLYQCLTRDGEILAGWSRGTVGVDHAGRTTLTFVWGWLSGATGGGESSGLSG